MENTSFVCMKKILNNKLTKLETLNKSIDVINAYGSSKSLFISNLFNNEQSTIVIICENSQQAIEIEKEIKYFTKLDNDSIIFIPDQETLPYDMESPHNALVSKRTRAFHTLANNTEDKKIIITTISNAIRKISSVKHWKDSFINLSVMDKISIELLTKNLIDLGYVENKQEITDYGQYTINNNVFDIYPYGEEGPVRIKFKNDTVNTIFQLNIATQRSVNEIESLLILPTKEMPIDNLARITFRTKFRTKFKQALGGTVYESVSSGDFISGIEYFLPLFQENTSDIFDFIPHNETAKFVLIGKIDKILTKLHEQINYRYNDLKREDGRMLLEPNLLWLSKAYFFEKISHFQVVNIEPEQQNSRNIISLECFHNGVFRLKNLQDIIHMISKKTENCKKIIFSIHSEIRQEKLQTICSLLDLEPEFNMDWDSVKESRAMCNIIISPLDIGFNIKDEKTVLVTEKEIFGLTIFAKNEKNDDLEVDYQALQDLKNLKLGDPVVHLKYGVGRVAGMTTLQVNNVDREYLKIEYGERGYNHVPMDQLDMVSRYGGVSTENAPLDKAASKSWKDGLSKAIVEIKETAKTLIEFQENRAKEVGVQLKKPDFEYHKFCGEFPFIETRDQKLAVSDIVDDLMSPIPMNRTVVGDVGFGKTEVAMKASFYVANQGFQVAVMVPTTLLAMQHFDNFKKRFASFNLRIECLTSHNKSTEKAIIKDIQNGLVDIVIGTHRLVQNDINFENLGLLVIDEEHRFGVKHKNALKQLKEKINVLSMTATPIPRTLSMSMHGVKDLSIIATPPAKRLSIRTIVKDGNEFLIKEALSRELSRSGQIFILHNSVETIEERANKIRNLIPGIRVCVGHGQMQENTLENVMASFYRHEYDVLVCTTIIETGIDVPNANTIIIENADKFGIAQLHQLRGRVGRSTHQAYAYLLPSKSSIGEKAKARLNALAKATKLGEGFVLSNNDLEIRGAGELLGDEQSGHIQNIGFTLYMRLLNRAIALLKEGEKLDNLFSYINGVQLELPLSCLIDSSYIKNPQMRLSYYKRLVSFESIIELNELQNEIEDRFGPIPEDTINIINVNKLRCYLKQVGIRSLVSNGQQGVIELSENFRMNGDKVIDLTQKYPDQYKIESNNRIRFFKETKTKEEIFNYLVTLLTNLAA